jgi:hypothetical protein
MRCYSLFVIRYPLYGELQSITRSNLKLETWNFELESLTSDFRLLTSDPVSPVSLVRSACCLLPAASCLELLLAVEQQGNRAVINQ